MINALNSEYERLYKKNLMPEKGWSYEKVAGVILLSKKGELLEILPYFDKIDYSRKEKQVPKKLIVPIHETKTSGIKPSFICDQIEYLFGYSKKRDEQKKIKILSDDEIKNKSSIEKLKRKIEKNQLKALNSFNSSKEFHISLLENCEDELSKALLNFFKNWDATKSNENNILTSLPEEMLNYNFIFQIGNVFLHEDNIFKDVWTNYLSNERNKKEIGRCLISGKTDVLTEIHGKIKGVNGAQAAGASLISFNENAFDSYGKESGYNATMGEEASFNYVTVLNYLLNISKNKISIGSDTCVFWSEAEDSEICENIFEASLFGNETEENKLFNFMKKIEKGDNFDNDILINSAFNIICFSPNNARLSVRFFYRNSFGNIIDSINLHYKQLEIQRPKYDKKKYLSLYFLLLETVRHGSKDKVSSPLLAGAVLKSIISGSLYPSRLYTDIILRIRATVDKEEINKKNKTERIEKITANKVAIIKAYLIRNKKDNFDEEDLSMSLNENSTNVAYNLGRLFALLENIQEEAIQGINSTIKDRYFNSACGTPRNIFPVILKLSNPHLKKMEEGRKIFFNKQLIEIMSKIDDFPTSLSLENQGIFILGYYHQVQKRFEKKEK